MSKIMTVEEALASMGAKTNASGKLVVNRFNKKNYEEFKKKGFQLEF